MSQPEVSIVTPTHRRPDLLERLISSLARQTVGSDRFEVIVVDDGSKDETTAVLEAAARAHKNLRWTSFSPGRGPAAARNKGVELGTAPLVLFLDDDIECADNLIETHLRIHAQHNDPMLGVLGRVDWSPDLRITAFMRWLDKSGLQFAYDTWLREGPVDPAYAAFYTANLSMHRDLLERSGGFDERFPYPAYEDMELAWRLQAMGFTMRFEPKARVFHTRAIDLETFRNRMSKVAESAVVLGSVQPDFPLSSGDTPRDWPVPNALRLRLLYLWTRLTGDPLRQPRYYRAEIAAGYREGLERGRKRLEASAREEQG